MIKLCFIVLLLCLIKNKCVLCFNIQIKQPMMIKPLIDQVDLEHPINFAVSIATFSKNLNATVLLAGAPAADLGDNYERPGSIFNCDLDDQTEKDFSDKSTNDKEIECKPIRFTNLIRGTNKQINLNSFSQIGSSISSSSAGDFIFCASGSINLYHESHYPNGQCWSGNYKSALSSVSTKNEVFLNKLININPLSDINKQTGGAVYFYSHGMFGFSSKMSKDDSRTVFYGAPGFNTWRGSVLQVKQSRNGSTSVNLYRHEMIENIYFGFSITLGRLFNDKKLLCIASAPKANHSNTTPGAIIIFEPSQTYHPKMIKEIRIKNKQKTIFGTTNGEYFGCGLEAIDLNNDGLDDIIVGSPYYSISTKELMDNGAVYIYMSNGEDLEEPVMLFGSSETNAMFGYSIASAGDLDQDGYQDFVVGAPYEDDSGCIYIYNGKSGSPSTFYSQKICAKQFNQFYRGFGIRIHGDFDVDFNKYPDLAVGAYLSKNAMVLKSRPVARLITKFNLNVTSINLNDKSAFCFNKRSKQKIYCFELKLCQTLEIKHADQLDDQLLTTLLQLDVFIAANQLSPSNFTPSSSLSRAYFELNSKYQPNYKKFFSSNSSSSSSITFQARLKSNTMVCHEPFLIMLRNEIEDKLQPILMTATHRLANKGDCVRNCPVLLNEDQQFSESINFHTGCKQTKCVSKLDLNMILQTQQNFANPNNTEQIELKQLVIGFHEYMNLNVRVTNEAEQAYSTYLELVLKPAVQIMKIESRCKSNELLTDDSLEIICNLGNPFQKGSLDLQFVFDIYHSKLEKQSLTINGKILTTSNYTTDSRLQQNLTLSLRRHVYLSLKDTQLATNIMHFDFKSKNVSIDKITFVNHFQMLKYGFSNIPLLDLIVHVPTNYTNRTLIHSINIEGIDGSSVECDRMEFEAFEMIADSELVFRNSKSDIVHPGMLEEDPSGEKIITTTEEAIKIVDEKESADFIVPTENNLYFNGQLNMNCQTMNCTKFKCSLKSIGFSKIIRLFKLTASIDLKSLNQMFNGLRKMNLSRLILKSDLKLNLPESLVELYQDTDDDTVESSILTASHSVIVTINQIPGQENLALWIIITSVLTGLFILFILIITLIKCGFFKRTKRDEIRRYKQKQRETLLLLNPIPQVLS